MKTKNPWLADASDGATGCTYEVRTVKDFLLIPADRRFIALREFHSWLHVQQAFMDLLLAAAESLGTPIPAESMKFNNDVFRWVDDGKATIGINIKALTETKASA
jgi:hypothetical protein